MPQPSVSTDTLLEIATRTLSLALGFREFRLFALDSREESLLPLACSRPEGMESLPLRRHTGLRQVLAGDVLLLERQSLPRHASWHSLFETWQAETLLIFPLTDGAGVANGLGVLISPERVSLSAAQREAALLQGRVLGQIILRATEAAHLRRRTRELESLFNRLAEGVLVFDHAGVFLCGNDAALPLLGWNEPPPPGYRLSQWEKGMSVQWPDGRPLSAGDGLGDRLARRERFAGLDLAFKNSAGFVVFVRASGGPLADEHGDSYVLVLQDVTPLRQRELELSALYTLTSAAIGADPLDNLLDRALEMILQCTNLCAGLLLYRDHDQSELFVSQRGMRPAVLDLVRRFEEDRGLGALYSCLAEVREAHAGSLDAEIVRRIRQSFTSWVVLPLQRNEKPTGLLLLGSAEYEQLSDGLSQLLSTITNQLILAIERSLAYADLGALVDRRTLELRESHKHLEATVAELKRMDQFKSDFLSNVSHELRTPLSGIIGYGEFLAEGVYGELSPEQQHVLDQLVTNSYQLMELINNLLDLSRIDAGKLMLFREPIELNVLFQQSVGKVLPQAIQKDITLHVAEEQGLLVEVDPGRIVQVLVNLLSNAIKFTPEGGRIEVGVTRDEDCVTVAVRDTGIGISCEQLPKLFQRFAQGDASSTRQFGGTGLGLAISRELIELHQQRIWVESRQGKGSTFSFTLPLWQAAPELMVNKG